ncbi:hypothetical protein DNHGIG_37920 [Collibacillus ludicampi]|jgi:uncharacterized protein YuzB (UPF0349 family)|uniref:DUF1450 domain-containing protein n=1 Tax=Collibacillus ludicampi TaxID=2771369 RepID=A0AAV4LKC7_9BACL|nr:DUF1450 domain-containing protein [Collibacillus ludicampi]GIM48243.1 hypothetical protein DNHGIG_37920 [Collibacillus ludicampi]
MSSLTLKFCKKNLELYSQSVYDKLKEQYPNEKIEIVDCAGKEICGLCADVPFAIRNNAIVGGRTPRDLFYKLTRGMEFLNTLPQAKEEIDSKAEQVSK